MRLSRAVIACGTLLWIATAIAAPAPVQSSSDSTDSELKLPLTMDKIWIRAEKKTGLGKLRAYQHSGNLTITDAGLEFVAKKNSFFFPMDSITMVSFGHMGNEVDTRWAVIGIREGETTRIMGFRDGRKGGYGHETDIIFRNLRLAAKKHGVAQFLASDGFKPYASLDDQLVFVVPEEWNVYVLTSVFIAELAPWGKTVFSPAKVEDLEYRDDDAELRRMYLGEDPAILLDRSQAGSGMSCNGISRRATEKLLARAGEDRIYGRDPESVSPLTVSEQLIAGCHGIRIEGRTRGADGIERVLDLRVFAHNDTLFTFGIRSRLDRYPARRPELESLLESVRLPLARR